MSALPADVLAAVTVAATDLPTVSKDVATIAGAVTAVAGAITAIIASARTGLGLLGLLPRSRRRRLARGLRNLDVGKTLDAFSATLGRTPTRLDRDGADRLHTFEFDDVDVVARTDDDQRVTEYTVTTKNREFTPKINLTPNSGNAPLVVRLGKTRFAEAGTPTAIDGYLGASDYGYSEVHYHDRPGGYRYFQLACGTGDEQPEAFFTMLGNVTFTDEDRNPWLGTPALADARVYAARAVSVVTSYTVLLQIPD